MGENTSIEWCHHTFNPWIGCAKVHTGCLNCYAETDMDKRRHVAAWGRDGTRVMTSPSYWKQPLKWNREAEAAGERRRVFCGSLCDVFEPSFDGQLVKGWERITDEPCVENGFHGRVWRPMLWHRDDIGICTVGQTTIGLIHGERFATLDDIRVKLFALIDRTPWLDWLLLTKRPENIQNCWGGVLHPFRRNVWLGTSVSDQYTADQLVPRLLTCRKISPVLFVSYEPAVGPVNFSPWIARSANANNEDGLYPSLDWIIIGGESGHNAREFDLAWPEAVIDACLSQDVAVFHKQIGRTPVSFGQQFDIKDPKGGDPDEWPDELRVRQIPSLFGIN